MTYIISARVFLKFFSGVAYGADADAILDLMLPRRGQRWGLEFKCTDAPRTTKSMHVALEDLQLTHLWVVYPGTLRYPLAEKITALPLGEIDTIGR